MFIKQVSVFIENKNGRLDKFTSLLGNNNIDLLALSVADTTNFGMIRAIVDDYENTVNILREHGYTVNLTDVLAVTVSDSPGGLSNVLKLLRNADISIEYLYSFVRRVGNDAVIIFRVDKPEEASKMFLENNIKLLNQNEI